MFGASLCQEGKFGVTKLMLSGVSKKKKFFKFIIQWRSFLEEKLNYFFLKVQSLGW